MLDYNERQRRDAARTSHGKGKKAQRRKAKMLARKQREPVIDMDPDPVESGDAVRKRKPRPVISKADQLLRGAAWAAMINRKRRIAAEKAKREEDVSLGREPDPLFKVGDPDELSRLPVIPISGKKVE